MKQSKRSLRSPKFKVRVAQRQRRNQRRIEKGKKPLALPLEIACAAERKEALKKGRMVFYHGKERIELPLCSKSSMGDAFLQGVYSTHDRRIVVFRSIGSNRSGKLAVFQLKGASEVLRSEFRNFDRSPDFMHMEIPELFRKMGLGLKGASKTEREQRAVAEGEFVLHLYSKSRFHDLISRKLGYSNQGTIPKTTQFYTGYSKKGKPNPKDNMDKFHRIEALTRTGALKIFTFPIQK